MSTSYPKRVYTIVSGFFRQDAPDTDGDKIGQLPARFGLLDESEDRWAKFQTRIGELNTTAEAGTRYKVFFLSRHGQGIHNIAEAKYGTQEWDRYWSKRNGDDELTWGPDPDLTEAGVKQAVEAHQAWKSERLHNIPLPQKHYASPLGRALRTFEETFAKGEFLDPTTLRVTILENLREEYGEHTCDQRSPRSAIATRYPPPIYSFEDGFEEEDVIWKAEERETKERVAERATKVMDRIFTLDRELYICITAHSGLINGFLKAMGRPRYALSTGGVLPLVIKAVEV
ncbi:phosphoglycerate mutase-like protein [Daedaleopsis nitida]|nr:phosphoglycerate mutase-like protein [Daedaleopsis nitida]